MCIRDRSSDDSILDFRFSGTRFVVMEADFSTATTASSGTLFVLKDAANLFNNLMRLNQGGDVVTPDNRFACKLQKNKWINIAIVGDFKKHVFDLYIDGELLYAKVPMPNSDFGFPATWRVTNGGSGTSGDLLVDNMRCYEGSARRTFDENVKVELSSIMPSDSVAINALGKAVAVSVQGGSYGHLRQAPSNWQKYPYHKRNSVCWCFLQPRGHYCLSLHHRSHPCI